jgi:hypothetical protein
MNIQNGGRQLSFWFARSFPAGLPTSRGAFKSRSLARAKNKIHGGPPGQDASRQLSLCLPPGRYTNILKKPQPEPVICSETSSKEGIGRKDLTFTFGNLKRLMVENGYTGSAVHFVSIAYHFAEENVYKGKRRDDGDVAIVHPLAVATRAVRMGMDISAVCAAILHDAIEDTNRRKKNEKSVLRDQLSDLFGTSPAALDCGRRTLELVLLLTKPKFVEDEKRWVFAREDEYFEIDDDYYINMDRLPAKKREGITLPEKISKEMHNLLIEAYELGKSEHGQESVGHEGLFNHTGVTTALRELVEGMHKIGKTEKKAKLSLYDDRSDAYYKYLLNSGDVDALVLKLLDNIHNAETMKGLPPEKQEKNLDTIARNTMRHAAIFLVQKDVEYLVGLFRGMGVDIARSVKPVVPTTQVMSFKLRDRFDVDALLRHPDPQYAYIILYGSNPIVAFAKDSVEVGLPPRLGFNYPAILDKYLRGHGFHITPGESVVPVTSPVHESIVRISGFTDAEERSKIIRSSGKPPDFFDILDKEGNVLSDASLAALATKDSNLLSSSAKDLISQAEKRYELLKVLLRRFYQDVIYYKLINYPLNADRMPPYAQHLYPEGDSKH